MKQKALLLVVVFSLQAIISCKMIRSVSTIKQITHSAIVSMPNSSSVQPFELVAGGVMVIVEIEQDGRKHLGHFLFDTGAPTVISTKFARSVGLVSTELKQSISANSVDGVQKENQEYIARDLLFTISGATVKKNAVLVRPLLAPSFICNGIDGLIGADVLSKFTLWIDFPSRSYVLYPAGEMENFKTAQFSIPFSPALFQRSPESEVRIEGISTEAIWDLGYNGSVLIQIKDTLKSPFAKLFKEATAYSTKTGLGTVNGTDSTANKQIWYKLLENLMSEAGDTIGVNRISTINYNPKLPFDKINLGTALLANSVIAFDWNGGKLHFLNKDTISKSKLPPAFSLAFDPNGRCFINTVRKDDPVYKSGLRVSAEVVEIDGKNSTYFISSQDRGRCALDSLARSLNRTVSSIRVQTADGVKTFTRTP